MKKPSIALIGMRGSGKTAVGRELAALLSMPHVDTDELVVRAAGCSIADIFVREGEAGFRAREAEAVRVAVARSPSVISVGGGAVLDAQNVAALQVVATLVWLTASSEVLCERVRNDSASPGARPPLSDLNALEEMRSVLAARTPIYGPAADLQIDTTHKTPLTVAEEIARDWQSRT